MLEVIVENETHTLACLIRPYLFKNGAEFGACVVEHPQQKHLKILIENSTNNEKDILETSIKNARQDLEMLLREVTT